MPGRGVGLREVRPIPVWYVTVQTLNRPHTSRALDQQQGHRQHPTEVQATSHEIDAVQREGGILAQEDSNGPYPPRSTRHYGVVVVVVCFYELKFRLSSQLKAASCVLCNSEMPPLKQVNGHSFTICLIVWCSPQSQSDEAM